MKLRLVASLNSNMTLSSLFRITIIRLLKLVLIKNLKEFLDLTVDDFEKPNYYIE